MPPGEYPFSHGPESWTSAVMSRILWDRAVGTDFEPWLAYGITNFPFPVAILSMTGGYHLRYANCVPESPQLGVPREMIQTALLGSFGSHDLVFPCCQVEHTPQIAVRMYCCHHRYHPPLQR